MNEVQKKQIADMYLDSTNIGSFGPVSQFRKVLLENGIELTQKQLKDILKEYIPSLTVFKPVQQRFARRVQYAAGIDVCWSADCMFFSPAISRSNRIAGLLVVVDNFSLFCWVRPFNKKTATRIGQIFHTLFEETERKPVTLQTDQGLVFSPDHTALAKSIFRVRILWECDGDRFGRRKRYPRLCKTTAKQGPNGRNDHKTTSCLHSNLHEGEEDETFL